MSSFLGGSGSPAELAWSLFVLVGTLALFVIGWRVVAQLARRHRDDDPRAASKALVAGVLGLALGLGGFGLLASFEAQSEVGIHATFAKALNQTVGEGDYLDNAKAAASKPATITLLTGRLAAASANYSADPSPANKDTRDNLSKALNQTKEDLATAQRNVKLLTANHQVWLMVEPHLRAGTDAEDAKARDILDAALDPNRIVPLLPASVACKRDAAKTGDCVLVGGKPEPAAITHSYRDLHTLSDVPVAEGVPAAYHHKEEFRTQMQSTLAWFVYPCVTGLFLAPFAFAGGSILNAAHVPSATVGFKPYPGKAAGFFLLLGAFGLFAIPFGAWTLRDLHKRSIEGQIAL
ncbi:MAG TPA: hypothetical protein VM241_08030 [Candidatus Thermoplasmatota archaeon]|nr:hypothetical protein [Candidatus Thermoplasmatota archaeon]